MSEQQTQTFRGVIEKVRNVNTRTGRKMITFEVGEYSFKAFGEHAAAAEQLERKHVEIVAKHNTFKGKHEYAVVMIADEMGGQWVKATDTRRSAPVSSSQTPVASPQQNLKRAGRHHWNLQGYGKNWKAREVGAWLNEFFDSLTEDEWREWKTFRDNHWPHTYAEDEKIAQIDEKIKLNNEKNRGGPYNFELENELVELWNERNGVVASGGGLSLESVKSRFNARLDLVHENLRRQTKVQSSVSGAGVQATPTVIPARDPTCVTSSALSGNEGLS